MKFSRILLVALVIVGVVGLTFAAVNRRPPVTIVKAPMIDRGSLVATTGLQGTITVQGNLPTQLKAMTCGRRNRHLHVPGVSVGVSDRRSSVVLVQSDQRTGRPATRRPAERKPAEVPVRRDRADDPAVADQAHVHEGEDGDSQLPGHPDLRDHQVTSIRIVRSSERRRRSAGVFLCRRTAIHCGV